MFMSLSSTLSFSALPNRQLPLMMHSFVTERETGTEALLCSISISRSQQYATTTLVNIVVYVISASVLVCVGRAANMRLFAESSLVLQLLVYVGWGITMSALALMLARPMSSAKSASLIGYTVAILGTIIAFVVTNILYGSIPGISVPDMAMPAVLMLPMPQLALARAVFLLNFACIHQGSCLSVLPPLDHEIWTVIMWLFGDAILWYCATLLLDSLPMLGHYVQLSANGIPCCSRRAKLQPLIVGIGTEQPLPESGGVESLSTALVAYDLSVRYPGAKTNALDHVSLTVPSGQCVGLLGPNGAGKSTLVATLCGGHDAQLLQYSGVLKCAGHDMRGPERAKALRAVGLCAQHDRFYAELTVAEHITLCALLRRGGRESATGIDGAELRAELTAAVDRAVVAVGLADHRHQPANTLSGGMKRRLSLAMAMCGVPKGGLLILDEPTTSLDPVARAEVLRIIARSRLEYGLGTLLVTHYLDEARLICDSGAILHNGRLKWTGAPAECDGLCVVHHGGDSTTNRLKTSVPGGPALRQIYTCGQTRHLEAADELTGGQDHVPVDPVACGLVLVRGTDSATDNLRQEASDPCAIGTPWIVGNLLSFQNVFISCTRDEHE
eukprot:SAG31_NODE_4242_length_3425_cov_1.926639_2_plen_614_part_00